MSNLANKAIKQAAKKAGVFHYEIAARLNMQESAFSRKLRCELPADEKERVLTVIEQLSAEKAEVT